AVDETVDRELATQHHDTEKQTDEQRSRHACPCGDALDSAGFPVPAVAPLSPDRGGGDEKQNLSDQTDDAAERSCHYQRHAHHSRDEQVENHLLSCNCAGEHESQRQRDRELHVAGEMVPVDEWTERRAMVQLTNPIDLRRTGKRLRQSEQSKQKTKDRDRPHENLKTIRRIDEYECRGEV